MSGYWARRTGSALLVLGLVLVLNFVLFRMMPGDPVASIIDPNFSPDAKTQLSALYGLDKPLPVQFLLYVKSTLSFDFGISFLTGRPVIEELRSRVPNTIALLGTSLLLSSFLGTWLGMKAALKRGSLLEKCVLWSGALSFSFPSFFVQLVLLMAFAATLPLFPLRGTLSVPP
ncbi:MAG: ABC transporter permease, partial [Synergistaceae bacterium]|nr:ABC transporter permease [Synergistaceae bacterium]